MTDIDTSPAAFFRAQRNEKLKETDVWGLADYPATAEQLAYRQALRDLPSHSDWPAVADSDWPTKPE
jgi:hypothetical protein